MSFLPQPGAHTRLSSRLHDAAGKARSLRGSRRGSFLVLVVGVLALLSVVAIVYATIGTQDLRARTALAKRTTLDDVPDQFARYVAGEVVGPDTLATWYDDSSNAVSGRPLLYRKTSDYPSTLWTVRSDLPLTDPRAFRPVAAAPITASGTLPTQWLPTTPWLAATEPSYLDFNGSGPTDAARKFMDMRDWAHITNLAPDGRFVNLFNLRNNFDAQPGDGPGQMSSQLSLFDAAGASTQVTDFGDTINADFPAFFTARQRGAFRPVGFNPAGYALDDARLAAYQWADVDGDGMLDSRWFELVDARDPGDLVRYLQTDGQYRYFFAARAVDLSALVNVNVATDQRARPDATSPVGLTPADVDLRRLLMAQDIYDGMMGNGTTALFPNGGYNMIFYPTTSTLGPISSAGNEPENYGQIPTHQGYTRIQAFRSGSGAYEAIRFTVGGGNVPPKERQASPSWSYAEAVPARPNVGMAQYALDAGLGDPTVAGDARKWTRWNFTQPPVTGLYPPAGRRSDFYRAASSLQDGAGLATSAGTNPDYTFYGFFGLTDLTDLLTYHAVNDPSVMSNLELATGGRDMTIATFPGTRRYGPLRDNRGLAVERDRRYAAVAMAQGSDFERTQMHFWSDIRQRLTTISGSRPLRLVADVNPDVLEARELRVDANAALKNKDASTLFRGYADALAGESGRAGVWAPTDTAEGRLFYGYQGPVPAVHVAAHMAVNMLDMADADDWPTVYPLLLQPSTSSTMQSIFSADSSAPANQRLLGEYTTVNGRQVPTRKLELPTARLATGPLATPSVANIYGVEPQPFITQVSSFTVQVDTPQAQGGDNDDTGEITIDGTLTSPDLLYRVVAFHLTNPFDRPVTLGSADMPQNTQYYNVTDSAFPPVDREEKFYYVEFGGLYFKLSALREQVLVPQAQADAAHASNTPAAGTSNAAEVGAYVNTVAGRDYVTLEPITIQPGETVVCTAVSRLPRTLLEDRVAQLDTTANARLPKTINDIIQRQLGNGVSGIRVLYIPRFDPSDGKLRLPTGASHLQVIPTGPGPGSTQLIANLYRSIRSGDEVLVDENDTLPGVYWDGVTTPNPTPTTEMRRRNFYANDQLVDRLRLPSATYLDRRLPAGQHQLSGSDGTDNTQQRGAAICFWAGIRRPESASVPGGIKDGMIPSYCLEPKYLPSWNKSANDGTNAATINWANFDTPQPTALAAKNFTLFRNRMRTAIATREVGQAPKDWSGPGPSGNPQIPETTNYGTALIPSIVSATSTRSGPPGTPPADGFEAPIPGSTTQTISTLRVADLLLPLGLGPTFTPFDPNGARYTNGTDPDMRYRWTTLGEAIAAASGYEPFPVPLDSPDVTWLLVPREVSAGTYQLTFDKCQLKTDDYVPFIDVNGNGVYDAAQDRRAGAEIPLAMGILDNFTAIPATISLTQAVPGTVNVNTAPLAVLRLLPLAAPPWTTLNNLDPSGKAWWWQDPASPTTPPAAPAGLDQGVDVAATMLAYRDKYDVAIRPSAWVSGVGAPRDGYVSFADDNSGTRLKPNETYRNLNGRTLSTQIGATSSSFGTGVNEQPGLRSLGELLAVRMRDTNANSPGYRFNMDHLGFDSVNNSKVGLDSINNGGTANSISDEPGEKLAIVNAMLNTTSSRSDYFAVYFLVNGYRRGDVENLRVNDPLVPSVQRRFLMVLDRSQVTRKGDAAKVVLLKELPL